MKKNIKKGIIGGWFLSSAVLVAAVLENPDFESGSLSGWVADAQSLTVGITANQSFNRNYAGYIGGSFSSPGGTVDRLVQSVDAMPGDEIVADGFVYWANYVPGDAGASASVEVALDGGVNSRVAQSFSAPNGNWQYFSITGLVFGLSNPDFEEGNLTGWSTSLDDLSASASSSQIVSGAQSLRMNGAWTDWSWNQVYQIIPAEVGDTLRVTGQMYIDDLESTAPWAVAGIKIESNFVGGDSGEDSHDQNAAEDSWIPVSLTVPITVAGDYIFRCMVAGGSGGSSSADVYFDDLKIWKEGAGSNNTQQVELSLTFAGTSVVGFTDETEIYLDSVTLAGSSANLESPEQIFVDLQNEAEALVTSTNPIPPVEFAPLFTYGYVGGTTNPVNYPASIEQGIAGFNFGVFSNNVTLTVTNRLKLSEFEGNGPAWFEFDQYAYLGVMPHIDRGGTVQIDSNAPYFVIGSKDNSSSEFGAGPFPEFYTFVAGSPVSSFPQRMSTAPGDGWPTEIEIIFTENFSTFDASLWSKYFSVSTLPASGPASNVKALEIYYELTDPGNTNLAYKSQEIHMGWGTEAEAQGLVDYPNVTFQDHNEVTLRKPWENNIVDDGTGWYVQQRPRGSATIEPLELHYWDGQNWLQEMYEEYLFTWPSAASGVRSIYDSDDDFKLPGPASYHIGFKVGHEYGVNELGQPQFPEVANIRGNGYFRMTDYGGVMGGSFRPIAADIFGLHQNLEDAPYMPEAYVRVVPRTTPSNEVDNSYAQAFLRFRSKTNSFFSSAAQVDMHFAPEEVEGSGVYMDIDTHTYVNKDMNREEHGPFALFAQVDMYWRGGEAINDETEGHDLDAVLLYKADGEWITHQMINPPTNIVHRSMGTFATGDRVYLLQQDRGPGSYGFATEQPYKLASNFEIELLDDGGLDVTLDIYEQSTDSETDDNVDIAPNVVGDLQEGDHLNYKIRYRALNAPGVYILNPNTVDGEESWGDRTYTIEFVATDDENELTADIFYGNGLDDQWIQINTNEIINVPTNTHYVSYEWDVSNIPAGAYYIKVTAEREDDERAGFDVSNTRLLVGDTFGMPANCGSSTNVTTLPFNDLGNDLGFESGSKAGWNASPSVWNEGTDHLAVDILTEQVYEGNYSARFDGSWSGWSWNWVWQEIPVVSGETLHVTGKIYIDHFDDNGTDWVAGGVKVENVSNFADQTGYEFNDTTTEGSWINVDFQRVATTTGVERVLIWVAGHDGDARVYFDDLRITSTNNLPVVTNFMEDCYWADASGISVLSHDTLYAQVSGTGSPAGQLWVADAGGTTSQVALANYVDVLSTHPQALHIPWSDFTGLDLTQVAEMGLDDGTNEYILSRAQTREAKVRLSSTFVAPPAYDEEGLPHYNPGEIMTAVVTIENISGAELSGINLQWVQEHGETRTWYETTHLHGDKLQIKQQIGDRLYGDFEQRLDGVTIPVGGSLVLTNTYTIPVGKLIDHEEYQIPYGEDFYIYRNYDTIAQTHLSIRDASGDNLYADDRIHIYSIDDDFDIDNDGLLDAWELEHFGDRTSADPEDDPDGDGYDNLSEQEAGTDPNNAGDYPGSTESVTIIQAPAKAFGGSAPGVWMAYNTLGEEHTLTYGLKDVGTLFMEDNFDDGDYNGWTILGDSSVVWSVTPTGELKSEITGGGGYGVAEQSILPSGFVNLTMEYDVYFSTPVINGGIEYRGRTLHINPTKAGWEDSSPAYETNTGIETGIWHHVVIHLHESVPYTVADVYVDDVAVFLNEPLEATGMTGTAVGVMNDCFTGSVMWDNIRVVDQQYSLNYVMVQGAASPNPASDPANLYPLVPDYDRSQWEHDGTVNGALYDWYSYLNGQNQESWMQTTVHFAPRLADEDPNFPDAVYPGSTADVPVEWEGLDTIPATLQVELRDVMNSNIIASASTSVTTASGSTTVGVLAPVSCASSGTYEWRAYIHPVGATSPWAERIGSDDTYRYDASGFPIEPEVEVTIDPDFRVYHDPGFPDDTVVYHWSGGSTSYDHNYNVGVMPEGAESSYMNGVSWAGYGFFKNTGTLDVSHYSGGYLTFWLKSSAYVKVELEGPPGVKSLKVVGNGTGSWQYISLPLTNFPAVNLQTMKGLFLITSDVAGAVEIDDVRYSVTP